MNKILKCLGLIILTLFFVIGTGAGSADATLTLEALAVTSSGVLTLNGAQASALNIGSTITTGNIVIGGVQTTGNIILAGTSGNVGIKTTTPLASLHVQGNSYFLGGNMDISNNGQIQNSDKNTYLLPYLGGTLDLTPDQIARADANGDGKVSWDDYSIWTALNGTVTESPGTISTARYNVVRNIGNTYGAYKTNFFYVNDTLGIGTTTSLSKLNLYGNASIGSTFINTAAPTDGMIIEGNVGIGTVTPTSKLQVVGLPVYANNAAAVAGGLTAGAFYRTGADPDPVMVVH